MSSPGTLSLNCSLVVKESSLVSPKTNGFEDFGNAAPSPSVVIWFPIQLKRSAPASLTPSVLFQMNVAVPAAAAPAKFVIGLPFVHIFQIYHKYYHTQ